MTSSEKHPTGQIAFVLKGYPRLSETFIAQEIHSLLGLGLDIAIYSLRHPTDTSTHAVNDEITASVSYLPEYLHKEPLRVFKGFWASLRKPGFSTCLAIWWKDLKRDRSRSRVRRFGQALVLAAELPANTSSIHAHFLHTPASVARYAAQLLTLPWTCSAHAKDIWTSPEWELREKLADCQWLTTCTAFNTEYLAGLSDKPNVSLNYHGLDLNRFPPAPIRNTHHDGSSEDDAVTLLSVGRAVPKKGYFALLNALATLPGELHWSFTHIGGGDLLTELKVAVLSTNISGIPELIENGVNGVLVEQLDTETLRTALSRLIVNPDLRAEMGRAGSHKVRTEFDKDINIQQLYEQFISMPGPL
jgi:glycosyltransferase involved in cell wall biosynthesis